MNNKTNYSLVGLFVIVGFISIAFFVYWLVKPSDEVEMKKYAIYFNESVLGLNLNSPVKYRGLDVGKVVKLGINPKNTEQVRVVISIDKNTPIKTTTVAKLTAQGITGLSYINLSLGDKNSPYLTTPPPGEKYPVIKTIPSFFESFQTSFGNVYNKVSHTLDKIDQVLDEKNQRELHKLLAQSAEFFNRLNKTLSDETISHLRGSMQNLDSITQQLDATMPKVDHLIEHTIAWERSIANSLASVMESYLSIEKSMNEIGEAFQRGDFDVKSMTSELIPAINKSLNSLNRLLAQLHATIDEYKENPRDILFKQTQTKKAPGEK